LCRWFQALYSNGERTAAEPNGCDGNHHRNLKSSRRVHVPTASRQR
jgi:hypothetical protein